MMPSCVWAIVVAGGSGARFGGAKQFELLGDRRVLDWAVGAARTVAAGVVVVLPAASIHLTDVGADTVVVGGPTRSASVRAGLAMVPAEADVIVVHDAARPLASPALFEAVVAALGAADAAVPVLPLFDTIKRVRDGAIVDTLDRADLVAVQTPQAFRAAALRRGHASGLDATDDAALVEATGGRVVTVPGEPHNAKLTTVDDLDRARRWIST
jgi:2-C-methyl-D-erythritol 4-phosphate cytidylyltransferase